MRVMPVVARDRENDKINNSFKIINYKLINYNMKKLGFCFLCQSDIHQLTLWENFFNHNYEKCNIYIHCYEKDKITQEFVKKNLIDKTLPSGWGDIYDIVQYVMKLSLQNNDYKLVLISESTLPVKPFNYVYDYLIHDTKGFLNYTPHDSSNKETLEIQNKRYELNSNKIINFKKQIDPKHWYFHEAWVIFNQEMMKIISSDTKYVNIFRDCFCPDENYVIFMYSLTDKMDLFHNLKTTYTNWNTESSNGKKHPQEYNILDKKKYKDFVNPNYLFARKFTKESDIGEYIPELYSLYNTKPKIVWNRCNVIFKIISDQIILKGNILFSYLSNNEINDYPIYDKIYHLLDSSITNQLNDKLKMGYLLDNEKITPKIYTSSEELVKTYYDDNKIWFIKYIHGSRGRHIMCKTTDQLRSIEISPRFIIQEGITDLDLYEGYKYVLRVFTLIHKKQFYLYRGLKKRVHGEKYDKNSLDYSAQVCGCHYSERITIYLETNGELYQKLKNHSLLVKDKLNDMIDQSDEYRYLLIGNDYLVKENKEVILIEMNPYPDLVNSDDIDEKINIPLMKDTINLVVNNEIHNYESLHSIFT